MFRSDPFAAIGILVMAVVFGLMLTNTIYENFINPCVKWEAHPTDTECVGDDTYRRCSPVQLCVVRESDKL